MKGFKPDAVEKSNHVIPAHVCFSELDRSAHVC